MDWTNKYKKAITFSYDDGVEQDLRLLDILNEYKLKATFNLNTGLDDKSDSWIYKERLEVKRLNLEKSKDAYMGHEIAVHTLTHPNLCALDNEAMERELLGDRENIERIFGVKPTGMAYPYGAYSDRVVDKLRQYEFKYARCVESSYNFDVQDNLLVFKPTCHHDDERLFELAERFLKMDTDKPQIFYVWGHAYEFEGNNNWDRLEKFCKLISGRDDIFYGTNEEVLLS